MTEVPAGDELMRQMLSMSEADLSVLRAAVAQLDPTQRSGGFGKKQQDVNLATTEGSPNDHLWSELEKRGWLAQRQVPPELSKTPSKFFTLLTLGREPITRLLTARDTTHRAHRNSMTKIYDEKCQPFVAELTAAVRAAGGGNKDVAIITEVLLMRTAQQIAAKGKEEAVLDDILKVARDTLRREAAEKRG